MDFKLELLITILISTGVFYIMQSIQKKREQKAEQSFKLLMKSRGLSTEILEKTNND